MTATWTEQDSINLTVTLVVRDRHHMPLYGAERRAVVERMVADGHTRQEIAERLCITAEALRKWAKQYDVTLPEPKSRPWWVEVAQPSSRAEYRRRYHRDYQAGRVAA